MKKCVRGNSMYLRIILLISSIFNSGLILRHLYLCMDDGEYFNIIIIFSFMTLIFSFINFISYLKNTKNKGE